MNYARDKFIRFLETKAPDARFDGASVVQLADRVLVLTGVTHRNLPDVGRVAVAMQRIDGDFVPAHDEKGLFTSGGAGGGGKSGGQIVKELHGKSKEELHSRPMTKEQRIAEYQAVNEHHAALTHRQIHQSGKTTSDQNEEYGRVSRVREKLESHPDLAETKSAEWHNYAQKEKINLTNPVTGLKPRKGETAEQHFQRFQAVKNSTDQANDALKEGRHEEAKAILKNAGMTKGQIETHVARHEQLQAISAHHERGFESAQQAHELARDSTNSTASALTQKALAASEAARGTADTAKIHDASNAHHAAMQAHQATADHESTSPADRERHLAIAKAHGVALHAHNEAYYVPTPKQLKEAKKAK